MYRKLQNKHSEFQHISFTNKIGLQFFILFPIFLYFVCKKLFQTIILHHLFREYKFQHRNENSLKNLIVNWDSGKYCTKKKGSRQLIIL